MSNLESPMFSYLLGLYGKMVEESNDGIYEGRVVETFQSLEISMAHYTPLFNALKELGCIELISRGARGRLTQYRLHDAPTETAYENLYNGLTDGRKPATVPVEEIGQRVTNLERRMEGIDIKKLVVNFEKRIKALEASQENPKGGSKK